MGPRNRSARYGFCAAKEKLRKDIGVGMVRTAREVLNGLRWRDPHQLEQAVVSYRDRTRPEGFRTIRGGGIVDIERRYLTTRTARLPYYMFERIEVAGEVLFERWAVPWPTPL